MGIHYSFFSQQTDWLANVRNCMCHELELILLHIPHMKDIIVTTLLPLDQATSTLIKYAVMALVTNATLMSTFILLCDVVLREDLQSEEQN